MARRPSHTRPSGPAPGRGTPHRSGGGKSSGGGRASGTWLFGRHPIEAALANPDRDIKRLVGTREAIDSLEALISKAKSRCPQPEIVQRADIDGIIGADAVHQGLAMEVFPLAESTPEDILAWTANRDHAVVVVLDQVTDPHNVGAVLRSAAAFGAVAVLTQDRHAPEETGTLAKAASGALERVPLVRVSNLVRALEILKEGGFWVAGMAADAPKTLAATNLTGKTVLCLGSEGEGLRRLTRDTCDHLVRLPMVPGAIESLNVSNAAAVALYELNRSVLETTAS